MKKFLICSVILLSVITGHTILSSLKSPSQDRRFNLILTGPEIDIVLESLRKLPLEKSGDIFLNIQRQANAQLQPPPKADTSKPKPKKQ